MKKKILIASFSLLIVGIGLFFGWKFYQNTTREIIAINDLKEVSLKEENQQLFLTGQAKLGNFEMVSNLGAMQKGDTLYVYVTKIKALIKSEEIHQNLSQIMVRDTAEPPKHIYLISGNNIEVKFEDKPEMNYYDVTKYSEKRELFK